MCIKYKIYGLSDIYICKTVFLTAVLNWIKIVCMYNVTAVPDLFSSFLGVRVTLLSATRPLRLLSCQRFSEGINQGLCQRCTANAEHLKSQRGFQPAGFA